MRGLASIRLRKLQPLQESIASANERISSLLRTRNMSSVCCQRDLDVCPPARLLVDRDVRFYLRLRPLVAFWRVRCQIPNVKDIRISDFGCLVPFISRKEET